MAAVRDIILTLPATLKTLTIFEDFNEDYNIAFCFNESIREYAIQPEFIRTPHPPVSEALAQRSCTLENLFASYMVDGEDFFKACKLEWVWNNLTSIALTSRLLSLCKPRFSAVNDMLVNAGIAALRMPRLRTLEIWNGMKRHACAFRYRVTETSTTVEWWRTWDLEIHLDIAEVWRKVALRKTRNELLILPSQMLRKQDVTSHGAAIRELKLGEVLHPISLKQILMESERWFYK